MYISLSLSITLDCRQMIKCYILDSSLRKEKLAIIFSFLVKQTHAEFAESDILPGEQTHEILLKTYKILIARTLVKFLPAFKIFEKNVCKHIKHIYTEEMSQKSERVRDIYVL